MPNPALETRAAFRELCDLIRDADVNFLDGPRAVFDDHTAVEGYRWLTEVLSVALDCYLWGDAARPSFVNLVGPTRKFGGDNADAFYCFAAIDPRRTYRVRVQRGDAVYFSLTVYGGPTDGRWSNRVVGILNDRTMQPNADGTFDIVLSPDAHPGNWIRLEPDAVCAVTRDYLVDPVRGRQATWHIDAVDPAPPPRLDDAEMALRLRTVANFVRDLLNICPIPLDESRLNLVEDRSTRPPISYGWVAVDAAYAMGSFHLEDDEALVIHGTLPSAPSGTCACGIRTCRRTTTATSARPSTAARSSTTPTGRGRSWSRTATRAIRTGCRPPATGAGASGFAGSAPPPRRRGPPRGS